MPRPMTTLARELARQHPGLPDPEAAITAGLVLVDGRPVDNPASRVHRGCSIVVRADAPLRGEAKLRAALDHFAIDVTGRTAIDAGAAAGGFTKVLLERGAARVYAVDAGHGQLLGSLRQDPRVVNLESTNLGQLDRQLVPDRIGVVTLDLSYLALADAVGQLDAVALAPACDLVALVKPMFELHLDHAPTDPASVQEGVARATDGITACGWRVLGSIASPVTGSRGAAEALLHATRVEGHAAVTQPGVTRW